VVLFCTAADMEWSDFPISPIYLPILQETARYIVKPDLSDATIPVGAPIQLRFDPTKMRRRANIEPPEDLGGGRVELSLVEDADTGQFYFRYQRTGSAGIYTLKLESPEGPPFNAPFAVNVQPDEGDLRRANVRKLADAVPGASVESTDQDAAFDLEESDRSEFWRTLIYVLVAAALLETLLAWRFGHHKKNKIAAEGKQVFVR